MAGQTASRFHGLLFLTIAATAAILPAPATCQFYAPVSNIVRQIGKQLQGGLYLPPDFVCNRSSVDGFTSSLKLTDGLTLHWAKVGANDTELKLAVEARRNSSIPTGWFAVGWSQDGAMYPGDAVVGNLQRAAVSAWSMTSADSSGIRRNMGIQLGKNSLTRNNESVLMKFSRFDGNGGIVPINIRGYQKIMWAYSADGARTIDYHQNNQGRTQIDFSCDGTKPRATAAATSAPGGSGSKCKKSGLPGYDFQKSMAGGGMILHWKKAVGSDVDMALQTTSANVKKGWMSLAWATSRAKMVPSDGVFGNLNGASTVKAYKIAGYSSSSLEPAGWSLGNAETVKQGNSVIVKFTRRKGTGSAAPMRLGTNQLIWAYSSSGSKSPGSHGGNYGRVLVDFSCQTTPSSGSAWFRKLGKGVGGGGGGDDDDEGGDD
eukprot:TRINITY_DN20760_c0_g1_i1.p1 TRINITY_DN20760_c0_g1~~TRINITY_DN20760_c0_g1_i1.p1  ORF type:complete len:431 (-),score=7.52 TRINITY_DN20760_c0_g1_i1:216-1508(-)